MPKHTVGEWTTLQNHLVGDDPGEKALWCLIENRTWGKYYHQSASIAVPKEHEHLYQAALANHPEIVEAGQKRERQRKAESAIKQEARGF